MQNGETRILLVHADDHDAKLDIAIGDGTTNIYGLWGHEETYKLAGEPDDTWQADAIETLAELLQGRYLIETLSWRGRPYRTLASDLVGNARGVIAIDSIFGFLPLPRSALTATSRAVDYGCAQAPESGANSNRPHGAKRS